MVALRTALAPLGSLASWTLVAFLVEVTLLLAELLLAQAVGQRPIAAAMLTAPSSGPALLGAAAVLARICARAIFPAIAAFFLARYASKHVLS